MKLKSMLFLSFITLSASDRLERVEVIESKLAFENSESVDSSFIKNSENIAEALNNIAGIYIEESVDGEKMIKVRGLKTEFIKLFEDDIPLYYNSGGLTKFDKISTQNLQNLEVIKSSASSLFGANSMSVINLTTKKPTKEFEANINYYIDSNSQDIVNLNLASKKGNFYYILNSNYLERDYFKLSRDFKINEFQDSYKRINSDRLQKDVNLKVGYLSGSDEYAIKVGTIKSKYGFPTHSQREYNYWRFNDWEHTNYYFYANNDFKTFKLKSRIYYDRYNNRIDGFGDKSFDTKWWSSIYNNNRLGGLIKAEWDEYKSNSFSAMVNYELHEHRHLTSYWEKYKTATLSIGLEDRINLNSKSDLILGANFDKYTPKRADGVALRDDIQTINPQIKYFHKFDEDTNINLSIAKKTKFPTLVEFYGGIKFSDFIEYNEALKEEESINYELSLSKAYRDIFMSTTLFYYDIDDFIVSLPISEMKSQFQNLSKVAYSGVEVNIEKESENNLFLFNYTYLNAKDKDNHKIEYIPKHKIVLNDTFKFNPNLSLFLHYEYNSKKDYLKTPNEWQKLSSFSKFDTKLIYTIDKNLNIEVGVDNLFDKNYALRYGYPREGRVYFSSLKYSY